MQEYGIEVTGLGLVTINLKNGLLPPTDAKKQDVVISGTNTQKLNWDPEERSRLRLTFMLLIKVVFRKSKTGISTMAYVEIPKWLEDAVTTKSRRSRDLVGARKVDLQRFYQNVHLKLDRMHQLHQLGKGSIIDIDTKELSNNGDEEDEVVIKTLKKNISTTSKQYSLKLAKSFTTGGEGGVTLNPNFFNIGVGVSAKGSISRTKTNEQSMGEGHERSLSQEYGIEGKITVPPRSKVNVTIKTYAVTYQARLDITILMPTNEFIYVQVRDTSCCAGCFGLCRNRSNYFITAEDALLQLSDNGEIHQDGGWSFVKSTADVHYIGELTEITKVVSSVGPTTI